MKRILVFGLVLLLLLSTACSSQPKEARLTGNLDPKNPVTVTLWHYYVGENQQALEEAVSRFNQTVGIEKGVIVEAVAQGSIAELEAAVTDSAKGVINAQPMPQIFSSYPDKAQEIDALGMVADLSGFFTEEEQNAYVADFLADGIFEGDRLLVIPVVKSTELTYINMTSWDAFATETGYDETGFATWEALYGTARAYYQWTDAKTPDTPWDGMGLMGFDNVANFIIAGNKQLGVDIIKGAGGANGEAVLQRDALRRVFDTYVTGMALGYYDAVSRFRSDDIKAGNLIAYVGSSSSAAYFPTWIEQDNKEMPIDFLPLAYPVFEGGEAYAIQQGAGMCVAKSTPGQEEGAVLFLKWFTDPAENIPFACSTGYLPVEQAAYESESLEEMLEGMREGDKAQQNVAGVYEIALRQITASNTYAAKPFPGSYDLRFALQNTLSEAAESARADAGPLKSQGLEEAEILAGLDLDARFEAWLEAVRMSLDALGVAYSEPEA